ATTGNWFCSLGLQTIAPGDEAIMSGMAEVVLAGGVEMMSQVPMSGYHTRLDPSITESYIGMGFTAERVAERWKVSREDQDAYAYESHRKAAVAQQEGRFDSQILPIEVPRVSGIGASRKVETGCFDRDELIRTDTSLERLARLKPAFKQGGTVTAGNASPYSD